MKLFLISLMLGFYCMGADLVCDSCELNSSIINGPATIYPCGHKFHKGCIDNHIFQEQDEYRLRYCGCKRSGRVIVITTCPVPTCRSRLTDRDMIKLIYDSEKISNEYRICGGILAFFPILLPCVFGVTLCRE